MLFRLLRPLLFQIDAETIHELAMGGLTLVETLPELAPAPLTTPALERVLWGVRFPNPLGLAAGFDKNARLPHVWHRFGFGFAELGTVTALPQPGNPKPRIFRLAEAEGLINRLGFNNDGAAVVAERLSDLVCNRRPPIPLGINIGKSAAVALADAPDDYAHSYALLAGLADYVTINVSSPNTAGLRTLQAASALNPIIDAIRGVVLEDGREHPPLLVKVAPDLSDEDLFEIVDLALERGVSGLIATNTTINRDGFPADTESGGMSGRPLAKRSTDVIRLLHQRAKGRVPIIGVGGIFDADDAFEKIQAGADLVQMYTGFVYGGPTAPKDLVLELSRLVEAAGFGSVADAVGSRSG